MSYDRFERDIWPAIRAKACSKSSSKSDYFGGVEPASLATQIHASLIWTEILSFIKGSVEGLLSPNGFLAYDQYRDLGKKRAPNFLGFRPFSLLPTIAIPPTRGTSL